MSTEDRVEMAAGLVTLTGALLVMLQALLLVFRVTEVITWPWWVVMLPLTCMFSGLFVIIMLALAVVLFGRD